MIKKFSSFLFKNLYIIRNYKKYHRTLNIHDLILKEKKKKTLRYNSPQFRILCQRPYSTNFSSTNSISPPSIASTQLNRASRCERRFKSARRARIYGIVAVSLGQYPLCNPCTAVCTRRNHTGRHRHYQPPRIPRCAGISTTMPHMQHGGRGRRRRGRELSDSTAEVLLLLNNLGDPRRIIIVGGREGREGREDRRNTAGGKCWPPGTESLDLWPLSSSSSSSSSSLLLFALG